MNGLTRLEKWAIGTGRSLALLGVLLAVGQAFRSGVVVTTGEPLSAWQVHLSLVAVGLTLVAAAYAHGAFEAQRRDLQSANAQLSIAQRGLDLALQAPKLEIGWATTQDTGVDINGRRAVVIVDPKDTEGSDRVCPLFVHISNGGHRVADIYEVTITFPPELCAGDDPVQKNLSFVRDTHAGAHNPHPIHYLQVTANGERIHSWRVLSMPDLAVFPHGLPLRFSLFGLDFSWRVKDSEGCASPLGRLRRVANAWNHPHILTVRVAGNWGQDDPEPLELELRQSELLASRRTTA